MPTDAAGLANGLYASLMDGMGLDIPSINFDDPHLKLPADLDSDVYKVVKKISNADLSSGAVNGTGTFDVLMQGFSVYLKNEFQENRISGAEYTKAFIALTGSAMQNATQFLLGRDNAYWQAVIAQAEAIKARVAMETAKVQYLEVLMNMLTSRANYALTKMKIATESMNFSTAEYQLQNILPQQLLLLKAQTKAAEAQTTDGFGGLMGKQRDLYQQQIVSYQKDAQIKIAKLYTDAWTVMKTMDEGLLPPGAFSNASLDAILGAL